jgi:hypothetical protein
MRKFATDGHLVDEEFELGFVTNEMAAIGGLVLRGFTSDLGANQAASVARRVFCAMRAAEVRQQRKEQKPAE